MKVGQYIVEVIFSPTGDKVASWDDWDSNVKVWQIKEKKILSSMRTVDSYRVIFSLDGKRIICGADRGNSAASKYYIISGWNVESGLCEFTLLNSHSDEIKALAFGNDSKLLMSCSWDGTIKLWDIENKRLVRPLGGHESSVTAADFNPYGHIVVSGDGKGTMKIIDASNSKLLHTIEKAHETYIVEINFSPDGKYIASADIDSIINIWDAATYKLLHSFKGPSFILFDISFFKDSNIIVTSGMDYSKRVWNIETKQSAAVYHFSDNSWCVFDDRGRFDCSKKGEQYINIVKGSSIQNIKDYWEKYYTENLLYKVINGQ